MRRGVARTLVIAVALVVSLLPLAWTALAAFGIVPDNSRRPPVWQARPTLDKFGEIAAAAPDFWRQLATGTTIAAAAAALTVFVAFLGAYALARASSRRGRPLSQGFLVLASLPVMAYVYPLAEMLRRAGLADSIVGVTLSEAAVTAPLAVYVLHGFLGQLSREWEEAAWLEGAGLGRILRQVVLPFAAPTLGATLIILFVMDWNQLVLPLVLAGVEVRTIPVTMVDFFTFERELEWPVAAAALLVSLVPLLVLVTVFHRLVQRFSLQGASSSG